MLYRCYISFSIFYKTSGKLKGLRTAESEPAGVIWAPGFLGLCRRWWGWSELRAPLRRLCTPALLTDGKSALCKTRSNS